MEKLCFCRGKPDARADGFSKLVPVTVNQEPPLHTLDNRMLAVRRPMNDLDNLAPAKDDGRQDLCKTKWLQDFHGAGW